MKTASLFLALICCLGLAARTCDVATAASAQAFGPRQNGVQIGIYATKLVVGGATHVLVSVVTKNVGSANLNLLPAFPFSKMNVTDSTGKTISNGYACPAWGSGKGPDADTTAVAPGTQRLDVTPLDLACYTTSPGTYNITVSTRLYLVEAATSSNPFASLTSNTLQVKIP